MGFLTEQQYFPLSLFFRLLKDKTLFWSKCVVFSSTISPEPSFIQCLVNIEPAASHVKLTVSPSISRLVDDAVMEAPDILSVGKRMDEYM